MSELRVRLAGTSGPGWRVWPDPEAIPPGALVETAECLFELTGAPGADGADLFVDDVPLEALRTREAGTARWRWSPGYHAGSAECRLRMDGRNIGFEVLLDPAAHKLSRDAFDTMVREILEDSFALFSLSAFHRSVARGDGRRPPPLARLQFLRSRIREIERIVHAIAAAPRRELRAEERTVALHQAAGATGAEILKSFRSGRVMPVHAAIPLHPGLGGRLPLGIVKRVRRSSLDRREHREIKACLRLWSAWLNNAAAALARSSGAQAAENPGGWSRRLRRLARSLDTLLALPMFDGVGDTAPRITASTIWRGDPRYRQFHRLWRDMSLGIASVFGDFLNMPLARTFDLYELWCFLRLLRAAAPRAGGSLDLGELFLADSSGLTLASGAVSVPLGESGLTLCFQRRYREYWREQDRIGSFSRDMQPDIVIEDRSPSATRGDALRLIVIDAKYRIGASLHDALSSAHMYRDAIVRGTGDGIEGAVTAAYLLAPDSPFIAPEWRETRLPARLFHPDYRRTFRFGAVTLQPGMPMAEVEAALDAMIADATAVEHAE